MCRKKGYRGVELGRKEGNRLVEWNRKERYYGVEWGTKKIKYTGGLSWAGRKETGELRGQEGKIQGG